MTTSKIAQKSDLGAMSNAPKTDYPTTSTAEDDFKSQANLTILGRVFINEQIGSASSVAGSVSSVALGRIEEKTIAQSSAELLMLLADPSAMEPLLLSDDSANRLNQIRGKIQPNQGEAPERLESAQKRHLVQHGAAGVVGSQIPRQIRAFLRNEAPSLMATASTRDHINELLAQSNFSGTASAQNALLTIADLGFVKLLTDLDKNEQNTLLQNYSTLLKERGQRTAGSRLLVSIVTIPLFTASITPALVWGAGMFLPGFQISAMTSNILMISASICIVLSLISGLIGRYLSHTGIEPLLSKLDKKHPEMIELAAKIGVVEPKLRDRLEAEYQKHHPSVKKYRSRIRRITRALGVPMIIASIAWASYLLTPLINHTQDVHTFISTITPSSLIVIGSLLCIGAVILGIGRFLSRALELKQLKARAQKMCPNAYTQFMQKKEAHQNELNGLYESIKTAIGSEGQATGEALDPKNFELFKYQITHEKQRFQEGLNEYLRSKAHQTLDDISYNEVTREWVVTIKILQGPLQTHYYNAIDGRYLEPSDELKVNQAMQLFLYGFEQQLTSQQSSTQEKLDATWTQLSKEFSEHADTIKAGVLDDQTTAFQWMQESLEQRLEWHFMTFVEQIGKDPDAFEGFLLSYRGMTTNTEKTNYIKQLKSTEAISEEASKTLETYQALLELKEEHSSTLCNMILRSTGTVEGIVASVAGVAGELSPSAMALGAIQRACETESALTLTQAQYDALRDLSATELKKDLKRTTGCQNLGNLIQEKGGTVCFNGVPLICYTETGGKALEAISRACESEKPLTLTQAQYDALDAARLTHDAGALNTALKVITNYQNSDTLIQATGMIDSTVGFNGVPLVHYTDTACTHYTETVREALDIIREACKTGSALTLTQDQYDALDAAHLTRDAGALNIALRVMTNCQNSDTLIQASGILDSTVCFKGIPLIQYTDTVLEALDIIGKACNTESGLTLTQAQYDALNAAHLIHDADALNTALRVMTNCQNSKTLIKKKGMWDNTVCFKDQPLATFIAAIELIACPPLSELSAAALNSPQPPAMAPRGESVQHSEISVDVPNP